MNRGGLNPLTFLLWLRQCFGRYLKTVSDGTAMTVTFCGGVPRPPGIKNAEKARSSTVESRVRMTTSDDDEAERKR